MQTLQDMILKLSEFWARQGCVLQQPLDLEVGAGTMHPDTFLRVLGPEPWRVAYVQPSRRPADGRYGDNPFRLGKHQQYQVILKPSPADVQQLYVRSLEAIGLDLSVHDLRFEEDNWEAPTLGAWGLGWQVMLDGMEITQFTYFQQAGGLELDPISAEITYGLERLTMFLSLSKSIYDIQWVEGVSYGQVRKQEEYELSRYYFELADVAFLAQQFEGNEREARRCLEAGLVLPAYECALKCSHQFNVLDARGAVSVTERVGLMKRVRDLAVACAKGYVESREKLGFPLLAGTAEEPAVPLAAPAAPVAPAAPAASGEPFSGGGESAGEYLLEVRAEEIPARMLEPGMRELATRLFEELMAKGIGPREIETGFAPRRLFLRLAGLPQREPDREEQLMGPPVRAAYAADGSPTPALLGFAKRAGLEPGEVKTVQTDKGEYLSATRALAGRPTSEVLSEVVPRLLAGLAWPKAMHWGSAVGPWVRPVHGIVSLFDGQVVPFTFHGIAAGSTTLGHPVLSPAPFAVEDGVGYRRSLAERGIEIDPRARRKTLLEEMHRCAEALGGRLVEDGPLLDKLAALCEIPGVVEGHFGEEFLELPAEVLATSLRDHQSALTVEPKEENTGRLLPCFLTVMDRPNDPKGRTQSGNEWVVAARLADARFFYGEDKKVGLEARAGQLDHLTFHDKLGSYAAKSERIAALAEGICRDLGLTAEQPLAKEAARLLKADLVTEVVKEFTSLQGMMGGIYAREEKHPEEVWQAVYDQYLPASTEDAIPRGVVGRIVGLADRLDTLVGIFGLGFVPTGSKDPFGLRRAAQGAVRILLEGELPVSLGSVIERAAALYGDRLGKAEKLAALRPFFDDRIRHVLGLAGYAYDEIEAGLAADATNLPDLQARVDAIHRVREEPGFLSVVLAAKRIANIVKDAPAGTLDEAALVEPAEKDLAAHAAKLATEVETAAREHDYVRCLSRIGDLAPVLDRFFVDVMVMAEDPAIRANRLALLQSILSTINRTAKLTEVVVDKAEQRAKAA